MKKVLVLSGSPRIKGNSSILCDEFIRGAQEAGNDVEKIYVTKKKVGGHFIRDWLARHFIS